jgi:ABC-type Mn2+/Zn2+ transport system permease subunit
MLADPSLSEQLQAAFLLFREAILAGTVAGLVLGWLGVHVLLRRMVFLAATLTQTAGLGVALAFWLGIALGVGLPPVLGALLLSLAAAGLLSLRLDRLGMSREAVMALLWIAAGGLAVLVGDRITQEAHDIAAILLGTAVLVSPADLWVLLGLAVPALATAIALQRRLVFTGLDPDGARVQGLPVRALELLLLGLITVVAAAATKALGALPVFAFSVLPAFAALLLLPSTRGAFALAGALGAASGGLGFLLAFLLDLPVGATQTVLAAVIAGVALAVRGVLTALRPSG